VLIQDFPGGVGCFEMCAKYCYGITITLSPHNVGEVRCGAEYLQMTETTEKSNLIFKLEVFLNSSILRGWKDAIICLRSSKVHMPWAEDLKVLILQSIFTRFTYTPFIHNTRSLHLHFCPQILEERKKRLLSRGFRMFLMFLIFDKSIVTM
jgi:hypothetical protein